MTKNWRDAKIPQWVRDAIDDEMRQSELKLALTWPETSRPKPVPFSWGDYDRCYGDPIAGTYYQHSEYGVNSIVIMEMGSHWRKWSFTVNGNTVSGCVRGHLFATREDAINDYLWGKCEKFATELLKIRKLLK